MPWDRQIDPVTGDLVRNDVGSWKTVTTAQTSVMNQLLAHRGECWHDPELGSRLHDLDAFIAAPETLAADEAARALARLEAAGRIAAIEVRAELQGPGRIAVATRFRDTSSSALVDTVVKSGG